MIKRIDLMKIVKIDGKDMVAKFNVGTLKFASKKVGLTVPQLLENINGLDLEIMTALIEGTVARYNDNFNPDMLDELSFNELVEVFELVMEDMSENMPEAEKKTLVATKKK